MSVTIRLSRTGKRNAPSYRVVAAATRDKRDGRFLDIIGVYNPSDPTLDFTYDKEKYKKWVNNGAIVSKAVKELIANKYQYVPYEPKKKEAPTKEVPAETKAEE